MTSFPLNLPPSPACLLFLLPSPFFRFSFFAFRFPNTEFRITNPDFLIMFFSAPYLITWLPNYLIT